MVLLLVMVLKFLTCKDKTRQVRMIKTKLLNDFFPRYEFGCIIKSALYIFNSVTAARLLRNLEVGKLVYK